MVKVKVATLLLVTILALLSTAATAQNYQPAYSQYPQYPKAMPSQLVPLRPISVPLRPFNAFPVIVTADAKAVFGRASLSWHDDEAGFLTNRTWEEIGLNVVLANALRLKYAFTTRLSSGDSVIPVGSLVVGKTNFNQNAGAGAGVGTGTGTGTSVGVTTQQSQPVKIDYSILPSHQFTLVCLSLRRELHPVIIGEYPQLSVSAASTSTGQQKSDSETLRSWFWGIGAEAIIPIPNARAMATVAVGDKYTFADCSYYHRVWPWMALGAGWQYKVFKFDRGSSLRMSGPYLGAEVVF